MINRSNVKMPLIAALPFSISLAGNETGSPGTYVPELQLTHHISNGYSTSSYDESVGFLNSRRDTKRDD